MGNIFKKKNKPIKNNDEYIVNEKDYGTVSYTVPANCHNELTLEDLTDISIPQPPVLDNSSDDDIKDYKFYLDQCNSIH